MVTVTAIEEAAHAEMKDMSNATASFLRLEVEGVGADTRLTITSWADVAPGTAVDVPATQGAMAAQVNRYVARVKTLLEGATPSSLLPAAHRRLHNPDTGSDRT